MKVPYSWLKKYIHCTFEAPALAHHLTLAGLEVEGIETVEGDEVFEIGLTPNLSHCFSIRGIARELSAILNIPFQAPAYRVEEDHDEDIRSAVSVTVHDPDLCPRYSCRVIRAVKVGPSPLWLQQKLRAAGLRPINNIVDITNYVQHELGQPLHAFDLDKLEGKEIHVRRAIGGELLITLDGIKRTIPKDALLIFDKKRPLAIAGVMGGQDSEVTEGTRNILLESAYFEPSQVRRCSKFLGLSTDSSKRFERGCDPNNTLCGLDNASMLMQEHAKGKVAKGVIDAGEKKFEELWRNKARQLAAEEPYALWNQPESTIEVLITDYGAQDYLYIIPPKIAELPIRVATHLPIPRESWEGVLELLLAQSGIGVRQLSTFVRELFFLEQDFTAPLLVINTQNDLALIPDDTRLLYLFPLHSADPLHTLRFFQKFSAPHQMAIDLVGTDLVLVGNARQIRELLKLYDFIRNHQSGREYKVALLKKMEGKGMQQLLEAMGTGPVEDRSEGKNNATYSSSPSQLRVVAVENFPKALLLIGTKEQIAQAEEAIASIEAALEDGKNKVVYWYTVKHSDPDEVAEVLSRIYTLMLSVEPSKEGGKVHPDDSVWKQKNYDPPKLVVEPQPLNPIEERSRRASMKHENILVDPKTSSVVMVVEQEMLPKLKEVLRRIDVPKRMVKIDVLLFEKRFDGQNRLGLNLLKVGGSSSHKNLTQFTHTTPTGSAADAAFGGSSTGGITEFFMSRKKTSHGIPAFDLAYNFLLSQEDIQINANPSLITLNQTPAAIDLVDEISISTGSESIATGSKPIIRESFERKQYGIHIKITPTIHLAGEDAEEKQAQDYITLKTLINFDTPFADINNRPKVFRRQIQNEVQIASGQTVILGGLRRKDLMDTKESLPFLGEVPGVGKLFSDNEMRDTNTEMFVFITPQIIYDPAEEAERLIREELQKRPGDLPEYIQSLEYAMSKERDKMVGLGLAKILKGRD